MMHPQTAEEFLEHLLWRRANKYDNIVVIDGEEGYGKSNTALALSLSMATMLKERGEPATFDMERVIFKSQEWHSALARSHGQKGLIWQMDEGGNLALSWDWNSAHGRALVQIAMQMRVLKGTLLWCIPNFAWLNVYLREHRVLARLVATRRGSVTPLYRERDPISGAVWFEEGPGWDVPDLSVVNPIMWGIYDKRKESSVPERIGELVASLQAREAEQVAKDDRVQRRAAKLKAEAEARRQDSTPLA